MISSESFIGTNSKSEIRNSTQISKQKEGKRKHARLEFSELESVWDLELGIWDLPQCGPSPGGISGSGSPSTRSWATRLRKNISSCSATVLGSGSRRSYWCEWSSA